MQGLISMLQDGTVSLLSRVRHFTPLQGDPAFFLPLFTGVRGRGILRTSRPESTLSAGPDDVQERRPSSVRYYRFLMYRTMRMLLLVHKKRQHKKDRGP